MRRRRRNFDMEGRVAGERGLYNVCVSVRGFVVVLGVVFLILGIRAIFTRHPVARHGIPLSHSDRHEKNEEGRTHVTVAAARGEASSLAAVPAPAEALCTDSG